MSITNLVFQDYTLWYFLRYIYKQFCASSPPESLFNFLWNLYISSSCLGKILKFMVVRLLENALQVVVLNLDIFANENFEIKCHKDLQA